MIRKVLWIEDNAGQDLSYWAAPVYVTGGFDLTIAPSASEGIAHLLEAEFDVVIVDVRLPPGPAGEWIALYSEASHSRREPRLGLELLYAVMQHPKAKVALESRPSWLEPSRIAVLTIERGHEQEVSVCMADIGIKIFQEKSAATPPTVLLDLIKRVLG